MEPNETVTNAPAKPDGSTVAGDELPKQYRPTEHEGRIWARWIDAGAFHADPGRVLRGEAQPYTILIPPPNVTAALHLGHALNNTLQDILARVHRMRGFETLWMPGTDHAGIATQAVVEKRVWKEEKKRRTDFARDEFVARIQAFKDEYEATITNQLQKMGCSCDWARQRFTMDPVCARAVREAFFRLFSDGLIYRGKRLVNWDPVLQTAVADDECYDEEVSSHFYYLRYPLVHAHGPTTQREREQGIAPPQDAVPVTWSELAARGYPNAERHPAEDQAWVTVATTRPETYLGDTAVAVNPHDLRAKPLRGLHVELPLVGRVIPIVEDSYVVLPSRTSPYHPEFAPGQVAEEADDGTPEDPKAKFATGFLKVTPAHDPNDAEIGHRHTLAAINMMSPDGRVSDKHGLADIGDAHILVGKTMAEARSLVIKEFHARGLLEETRPYSHSVKHSDRSKAVIEPYLSDQWYVKVTDPRLAQAANEALVPEQRTAAGGIGMESASSGGTTSNNTLRFYPARYAKTYEQWHDNIRDWCISRQLWWGHRIPVWSKRGVTPEDKERLKLILSVSYDPFTDDSQAMAFQCVKEPQGTETLHCCVRSPDHREIGLLEAEGFTQDPDVLDTWFSSALWPMSTMGWPNPAQAASDTGDPSTAHLLHAFNPTSVLTTAREIITLWVSRMVMFNRYLMPRGWGNRTDAPQPLEPGGQGAGPIPFHDVFIHAVIQDGEGRKMSKTLGNGVDPLDIIDSHGADAMRFTLCQMTTQTQDVRMPVVRDSKSGKNTSPKFDIGRNFANKVWNATRFTLGMLAGHESPASPARPTDLPSQWMLSRLAAGVEACNTALAQYEFSEYAQHLYDLVWRDFCDWYLEAVKPTIGTDAAQRTALANILSSLLRLLHPVLPYMTEAAWEHLGGRTFGNVPGLHLHAPRKRGLLCTAGWPVCEPSLRDAAVEQRFSRIQSLVAAIREVRAAQNVPPKRRITLHTPAGIPAWPADEASLIATFATIGQTTEQPPSKGGVAITFEAQPYAVSDLADASEDAGEAERAFLSKRKGDLAKEIATYEGRLANPGYAQKAPPAMVQETKDKLAKAQAELALVLTKLEEHG
ncbi:MAG: valine--tRNA ligase [Phycisphaeraceae bacterium]|nr:valine--tRNA ligase [Phycisphaeraceae bacterium]